MKCERAPRSRFRLAPLVALAVTFGACDGPVFTPSSTPSVGLTANAPNPVKLGALVTFSVTASVPGKPANIAIQNIHLDFGDGQSAELGDVPPTNGVAHAYGSPGTFMASAIATDTLGHQAKASLAVVVAPASPPSVGLTSDAANPTAVGKAVTFQVTASVPGPQAGATTFIASVHLDFGDGQSADLGASPPSAGVQHTYAAAGTYTATATATDTDHRSATASVTIVVK